MADSTNNLDQIDRTAASSDVMANALLDAASPATAYGRRASACAGLVFGYYGIRRGGTVIPNGSHTCTASATTYMVVDKATGAPSFSTDDTDWLDTDNYAHSYKLIANTSSLTYEDHRFGPGGVLGAGGDQALADGDYGDIEVSDSGAVMEISDDVLSPFMRTVADDADAATARATLGVDTAITAAINALVASAPGALDTLDELAAALGDDANFAASVTTALAGKAPLASPALTGTPTAPTAAPGTNTTQLASTAFVTAAIAAAGSYADAYDVRHFGSLANDGTTDDSATFIAAAASGARVIYAENLNCAILNVVDIPAGQVWVMSGSVFTTTVTNAAMFRANLVDDWALIGPFRIVGPGSSSGTAKGVHIIGCNRWRIQDLTARTVRGWGVYVVDGAESGTLRGDQGYLGNYRAESCYIGYEDTGGSAAEYSTLEAPFITGCGTGLITVAGNVQVNGGHIVDNTGDGVQVNAGTNHAHGQFVGVNINHNGGWDLNCTGVINGEDFVGCHFYQGGIYLNGCKGVVIRDGHFDGDVVNDSGTGSGQNYILDMYCPGSYGTGSGGKIAVSGNATSALTLAGLMGAGAPDASGEFECFTVAVSDETTALTTGTAKLTFRMPFAMTLFPGSSGLRASVNTAPTGSTLIVDVNEGGSTIMTTNKLSIDASEKTSTTAATTCGITDVSLADDAEMSIDIDQVGSTIAGKGLKVMFRGTRPKAV